MPIKKDDRRRNQVYLEVNTGINSKYDGGPSWKFWKKKRYIVSILGFFGFFNVFTLRSILSIAIVDMTTLKNVTLENQTVIEKREFDWDSTIQGYVLSSFFYGYITTQLLGGYLAARFGGARVYGAGIATTAVFTILTPWVAKTNVYLLIALRTAEGFFEGVNYPAVLAIWSKWAPPLEKSRLSSIAISGTYVGTVVAMPIGSLLATAFGWESIFYVFGGCALFWYIVWTIVVKDSPDKDPRISPQELKYIAESINAAKSEEVLVVPWKSILTSKAVWALSLILSCETWGFHTLITFLPQMMKSALKFDLNKSGLLSALPYVAMAFSMQVSGHLADWLVKGKYMTLTNVRKMTIFVGFTSQATFLLSAALWISPVTTPIFVVIGAIFGGVALSGIIISPLDLAPKFASIVYGINNTFGTIPGIVSPILTGYIVRDLTDMNQWKIIFFISSAFYLVGAITSTFFISGEVQQWAKTNVTEILNSNRTEAQLTNGKEQVQIEDT